MPNWVFNGLTVEGNPEQVKKMMEQLNKPFKKKHDSWNMETHQMEIKETLYPNPIFAFHNIYNHLDHGITDEDYLAQPPRDMPIAEQMKFQTNDWYSFNTREWGTKWDVAVHADEKYPDTNMEDTVKRFQNQNMAGCAVTVNTQRMKLHIAKDVTTTHVLNVDMARLMKNVRPMMYNRRHDEN